jgi:class 3 adenylate cyclase/TolB-like protein/tetratricopeptide (TPR) repeat protein
MQSTPVARRLAAIFIADVVGYTRLMEADETGTHSRLHELRDNVTDPKIAAHGGRIVKTAGDGMLVEFPSATEALRCAVEVQREMGHRNLYVAPETRIELRIGINLGDILIDGDDIAGDGVNVASRLETLADPGGICIGSTVYEQVHEDLDFGVVDIGDQQVKNIARPIRVYRVTLGMGTHRNQRIKMAFRGRPLVWLATLVGLLVIGVIATILVSNNPGHTVNATATMDTTVGAAPPMSIAILPFSVSGGGPADRQLGEALTRDVTTELGRSARYAWVISYGLASSQKGPAIDARTVGRALKVRYLAEGEVLHVGDKLVLNATLVDTENATQIWDGEFDVPASAVEAGHDAVVAQITKSLRSALLDAETRRATRDSRVSGNPTELALRGDAALENQSAIGAREARTLYDKALRLDPSLTAALIGEVYAIDTLPDYDPRVDRAHAMQEEEDFSLRAVAADRNDPRAWTVRAFARGRQFRWAEAKEALAEVLRIDRYRSDIYIQRAWISIWNGKPEDAFAQLNKAIALDPREADNADLLGVRCRAQLSLGHYEEAISSCERAAALNNWWVNYMFLTAAYAQQGEMAKAMAARSQVLKYQPGLTIARLKAVRISDNEVFWQQTETYVFSGLRKAGIPDQ